MISAIKKAEDGDDVVVRVVEMEGRDTVASLALRDPIRSAVHTDLIEYGSTPVDVEDGDLAVHVGHHAIESFKLTLAR